MVNHTSTHASRDRCGKPISVGVRQLLLSFARNILHVARSVSSSHITRTVSIILQVLRSANLHKLHVCMNTNATHLCVENRFGEAMSVSS